MTANSLAHLWKTANLSAMYCWVEGGNDTWARRVWVCVFVQAGNSRSVYGFVAVEGHNGRKEFECNDSYRHHISTLLFPWADYDYVDDGADEHTFINKERCEWEAGEGNERRITNRRDELRSSRLSFKAINNFFFFFQPSNESRAISKFK